MVYAKKNRGCKMKIIDKHCIRRPVMYKYSESPEKKTCAHHHKVTILLLSYPIFKQNVSYCKSLSIKPIRKYVSITYKKHIK
jgi:hypothetical protein